MGLHLLYIMQLAQKDRQLYAIKLSKLINRVKIILWKRELYEIFKKFIGN